MDATPETIQQLETRFWQTMVDKNPEAAMQLIAEQCLITGPMGTMRSDPEDYKRMTEQGEWNLDKFEFSDVQVIFPNPKTSGNARYTYLAATAFAKEKFKGDEAKVKEFITALFNHVPVFDTGGRAATTTFAERGIGDVLITFESETQGIAREYGTDKYQQVVPSISLLAEFPVAVVDKVADEHGTRDLAKSYLDFLYTPEGQEIEAENGLRVRDAAVAEKFKDKFPDVRLVTVEEVFGGWDKVQAEHFADGGLLDQAYGKR